MAAEPDLGRAYGDRVMAPRELTPQDEEMLSDMLEKRPEFWEALRAVETLLAYVGYPIGDDEDLQNTPARVVNALVELTSEPGPAPGELLAVTFPQQVDEMVVVAGVEFTSLCIHHLLPFTGTAAVGYLPRDGRVVGLSKLARLVDHHAHKLQIQERMTADIADDIIQHLNPRGVGVQLRATHACMSCRGARKGGVMVTQSLLGSFREDPAQRAEFFDLCRYGR